MKRSILFINSENRSMNKGIWYGIAAFGVWGILPIYWKALHAVPALEIVTHRLAWSLVFIVILVSVRHEWGGLKKALNRRTLLIYTAAACLLSVNWLGYIWGVNHGLIVETSLGYFINPLVNVLLAVVFLGEKLPVSKWLPIGLAAVGVIYLTFSYGSVPWLAFGLAFSFGLYGLIKKLAPLGSLFGLTLETAILLLPSLGYLAWIESQGQAAFGHSALHVNLMLPLAGVVTAIPLLLFSSAARSIPLSTMGLLQYLSPTLQFLLGVFLFGEPFSQHQLIGFSIIWLALIIFSAGSLYDQRKALQATAV